MARKILDTCVLISFWRRHCHRLIADRDRPPSDPALRAAIREKAALLGRQYESSEIVTPVAIEFLAGFTRGRDVELGELFLQQFDCIDRGRITPEDWENARRLAKRVPRDGRRRQLGDCLIQALATRLGREVFTWENRFSR